ncbi:hypothetical protein [Ancylobacter sp. IITR112]|uniref:hypothetical protein n=1 Tax=Ancylobacter sp. IITR112 TaxID=3138073 RepID=UPI00352A667D
MTDTTGQPAGPHQTLGDESFMSAADLRGYMDKIALAKMNEAVEAMDHARRAKEELAKTLAQPIDLTPQKLHEMAEALQVKMRAAAERGETEIMVMRFPNTLCTDHGRAINNAEEGWPDTLTGRPRQAYELWRDHLRAAGYRLSALIVEWPNDMPGDVGMYLTWGKK